MGLHGGCLQLDQNGEDLGMTTEAEKLASEYRKELDAVSNRNYELRMKVQEQAAEIERKDALLREAVRALKYHSDQTRPIERTFDTMDKIKEELK